jgi:hypothetical protein
MISASWDLFSVNWEKEVNDDVMIEMMMIYEKNF